jgi:hypothetical protein
MVKGIAQESKMKTGKADGSFHPLTGGLSLFPLQLAKDGQFHGGESKP